MKTSALVPIVILLAAASTPAHAQIYKWVDGSGTTHYSDKAPAGARKLDTVSDRVSVYAAPEMPKAPARPDAASSAALNDRVDRLERQLYAEQLARQQAELAAYSQPQEVYYVPVGVAPIRNRHDGFRRFPGTKPAGVVGPGIMPGTFNGPNAITAGNVTLRTGVPAFRGRGAAF
jgi:Domain of unknown function (DUF4124)